MLCENYMKMINVHNVDTFKEYVYVLHEAIDIYRWCYTVYIYVNWRCKKKKEVISRSWKRMIWQIYFFYEIRFLYIL